MKRHVFALTTGAALVASLLVGGYGSAQASTDDTAQGDVPQATAVSKAATPRDMNDQIVGAPQPGNLSKAPAPKGTDGQIDLATEPGHSSTEVDGK